MNNLLEVKNLKVSFHTYAGEVQAVRDISFNIEKSRTTAIVGESGCGKSVTAKSLMGLTSAINGKILDGSKIIYNNKNIMDFTNKELINYRGGEVGMVFQDALTALNPTMTIGKQIAENLLIHSSMGKKAAHQRSIELLRDVGIPDPEIRVKQYPHEFSGGMRQRVMIAIAIACNPKILIADEPTTALDVTIQAQIIDLIKSLQEKLDMAVILITHDLGIVADIAHEVIVMYCGKIVERATVDELFYNPKHPYTKGLLKSVIRLDLPSTEKLPSIEGMPPSLIDPPLGCAFAQRCPSVKKICRDENPDVTEFSPTHYSSCWLYNMDEAK